VKKRDRKSNTLTVDDRKQYSGSFSKVELEGNKSRQSMIKKPSRFNHRQPSQERSLEAVIDTPSPIKDTTMPDREMIFKREQRKLLEEGSILSLGPDEPTIDLNPLSGRREDA